MLIIMCKSKIHRARVTRTELHYNGSVGIDGKLLGAAGIYPNEIVQIVNFNNGARFETYVIDEKPDSGNVVLYGPAARLGSAGDEIIIMAKAFVDAKEIRGIKPKIVYVDKNNAIIKNRA